MYKKYECKKPKIGIGQKLHAPKRKKIRINPYVDFGYGMFL